MYMGSFGMYRTTTQFDFDAATRDSAQRVSLVLRFFGGPWGAYGSLDSVGEIFGLKVFWVLGLEHCKASWGRGIGADAFV